MVFDAGEVRSNLCLFVVQEKGKSERISGRHFLFMFNSRESTSRGEKRASGIDVLRSH